MFNVSLESPALMRKLCSTVGALPLTSQLMHATDMSICVTWVVPVQTVVDTLDSYLPTDRMGLTTGSSSDRQCPSLTSSHLWWCFCALVSPRSIHETGLLMLGELHEKQSVTLRCTLQGWCGA